MQRLRILSVVLALWVVWHLVFGMLATFAPEIGASAIGWAPAAGWNADLFTMSTQYGMVMLLLGIMYFVMALDPIRYLGLISVAIVEQALGIVFAIYIYLTVGQLTIAQLFIQGAVNVVIMVVFALLWAGLRDRPVATAPAR